MKIPVTKRGMIQTALGSIFYLMNDGRTLSGNNTSTSIINERPPILCFHMSPRSSDEYLEVLPLLAAGDEDDNDGRVVIAFDMPGYGASENPPRSCTIDEISDAFLGAADLILSETTSDGEDSSENDSRSYVTIGSLMGNYCCVSLASRYPERIKAGVLTNPWFNPDASDHSAPSSETTDSTDSSSKAIEDSFVLKDDGSHLVDLHNKRSRWLDPELNFRVVASEISYLANRRERYSNGISIQGGNEYDFETPVQKIAEMEGENSPDFLCIIGESCASMFDRFGLDGTKRFDEACKMLFGETDDFRFKDRIVRVERLQGEKSTLNVVNQMPEEFAAACNRFLSECGC